MAQRLEEILSQPATAKHAARWFIRSGVLEQFRTAKEIAEEGVDGYREFRAAEDW